MTKEERAVYQVQYYIDHKEILKAYQIQYRKNNKDILKTSAAQWYKNNKEAVKLTGAQFYKDNKETVKIRVAQYYKNNKETMDAYQARVRKTHNTRWRVRNPDLCALWSSNRAIKLERATPCWSETEAIKIVYLKRDEYKKLYGIKFEVDHIIPIKSDTVCGLHVLANLQLLDKLLNGSKHNNYQTDW